MITASLHRSPTGPVLGACAWKSSGAHHGAPTGAARPCAALAVRASSARSYDASREITITLLIMVR